MTVLSLVLAVVLYGSLLWTGRQVVRDPSDRLLRAVFLCMFSAGLSFPFGLPVVIRLVGGLAGDGTAKLLQNLFLLGAVYFLGCFFIHSASDPAAARTRVRWHAVPFAATAVIASAAMAVTPHAERGHTYATADMRVPGVAVFYVSAGAYLTYALAAALFWTVRYARLASRPLATGLRMVAAALTGMVLASAVRECLTLVRLLGGGVPHPVITGAKLLLDLAIPLFVAGVVYPGLVTRWASIRLWWHHGRVYHRLAPLWEALHLAFPEDALERTGGGRRWDALSPRGVHRRYYRRVIECRDGLVRISPYLAMEAATADAEAPLTPEVAARHLRTALRAYASGEDAPSQAVPVALPGEGDGSLESDVRQLIRLSETLTAQF
ncbi:MAB_1171c family putative transporter [Streptomyces sp. NPDC058412]|uniref:MAB_1171c family putative transporter n=1 Tax=Streptomyces sp. NPDC058412 TaxID=3346486 RepID=UPI00364DC7D0